MNQKTKSRTLMDYIPMGALAVIFVGFSETLAAARDKAALHQYDIDVSQEMIAQGAANTASSLFGGMVVVGSLSKAFMEVTIFPILLIAIGIAALVFGRRLAVLGAAVGALLVTRGLTQLLPSLQGVIGTLAVLVLAGGSIAYQGGLLSGRKTAPPAPTAMGEGSSTTKNAPPLSAK